MCSGAMWEHGTDDDRDYVKKKNMINNKLYLLTVKQYDVFLIMINCLNSLFSYSS